jgi:hypothetical protein
LTVALAKVSSHFREKRALAPEAVWGQFNNYRSNGLIGSVVVPITLLGLILSGAVFGHELGRAAVLVLDQAELWVRGRAGCWRGERGVVLGEVYLRSVEGYQLLKLFRRRIPNIPRDIRVIRGLGFGLDMRAIEAVEQWRIQPAMKDGRPVNVQISVEVGFRLY